MKFSLIRDVSWYRCVWHAVQICYNGRYCYTELINFTGARSVGMHFAPWRCICLVLLTGKRAGNHECRQCRTERTDQFPVQTLSRLHLLQPHVVGGHRRARYAICRIDHQALRPTQLRFPLRPSPDPGGIHAQMIALWTTWNCFWLLCDGGTVDMWRGQINGEHGNIFVYSCVGTLKDEGAPFYLYLFINVR